MSSSRSNQAAINRRAAGGQPQPMQNRPSQQVPSQQVYRQYAPQQNQPPPPPINSQQFQGGQNGYVEQVAGSGPGSKGGKISISDAIALTTIRLGRLETIINKIQEEGIQGVINEGNQNVDNSVVMSILSRIEVLEKKSQQSQVIPQVTPVDSKQFDDKFNKLTNDMNGLKDEIVKFKNITTNLNTSNINGIDKKYVESFMNETDEGLARLDGDINNIYRELKELKDTLIKLQTYTMETNQKLTDLVFKNIDNNYTKQEVGTSIDNIYQMNENNTNNEQFENIQYNNDFVPTVNTYLYHDESFLYNQDNSVNEYKSETEQVEEQVEEQTVSVSIKDYIQNELNNF